jgi:hypothetical protein
MRPPRSLFTLFAAPVCLFLAACSSHSGSTAAVSTVRFVNADATVSLQVNSSGAVQFAPQGPGTASDYISVDPGVYTITVAATSGSSALASPSLTALLSGSQTYALIAYVRDNAVVVQAVTENQASPAAGNTTLGFSNLSQDSGALDVYVVAPGTASLTGLAPTFASAVFRPTPIYTTFFSGTFDVVATAAGDPLDVRMRWPSVSLGSGLIQVLVATSTPGGTLVNAALLTQGGAVNFLAATNARLRLVSALPPATVAPVTAKVGSVSIGPVFSPNPGTYTLVPGNSTTYTLSVNGTAVTTLPAATFSTGGDFTVLVYGTPGAPLVAVFTDDNQLPGVLGQVNLRLVNAGVNVPGGLSLYANNVQAASQVAYGGASGYFGVPAADSVLELVEALAAPVTTTLQLGPSGSVYTVFVIDTTLTPYVIRDR